MEKGEIRLVYCPTDEMWADYYTKPLQGSKFTYFRDLIMNWNSHDETVLDCNNDHRLSTTAQLKRDTTASGNIGATSPDIEG